MFGLFSLLLLWPAPLLLAPHVVIIGCHGMSPDGVRQARAPNLKQLMKTGAYTLHARGVMPTSSSPNWASMIMGAGPADHGGRGRSHGGNTMAELEIPWILNGPGVAAGKEITTPVNTFDTAATVAYIFGLTPSAVWIARPVLEAFAK